MTERRQREHLTKEISITLGRTYFENVLITGHRDDQSADFFIYVFAPQESFPWQPGEIIEGAIWTGNNGLYCSVKVNEIQPRETPNGPWVRVRTLLRGDLCWEIASQLWPM